MFQERKPSPEVQVRSQVSRERRRFNAEYKRRMILEAEKCGSGQLGSLLRREALTYNKTVLRSCSPPMPHIREPIGRALFAANRSSKVRLLPFGLIRHSPAQIFPKLFQEVVSKSLTHSGSSTLEVCAKFN